MMSLRSFLSPGATLGHSNAAFLRQALRTPWCFPSEGAAHDEALRLGAVVPAARPAEALLLSVGGGGERASLWRFCRSGRAPGVNKPLGESTSNSLSTAGRIVTHDLPVLLDAGQRNASPWVAEHIWTDGPGVDAALDGPSYGLSMLLAIASEALGLPVPGDLAASAGIDASGALHSVGSLERKIRLLNDNALGVKRLIVFAEQEDEAKRAVAAIASKLRIVAVKNVAGAFTEAFTDVDNEMRRRFRDERVAHRYARKLFFLTLEGAPLLSWKGVEHAAELLLEQLPEDCPSREDAWRARRMAARHLGRTDVELPWPTDPSFLAMRRPVRQTYLAHVVQAAADASANNLEQTVSKARACVPTLRDCFDADLKVLGAIARARSSQRRYDDALELTTDIVPAWIGIGRADGASYVLCEHLRVLGILDRKRELAGELLAEWLSAVDSDLRTNDVSRAFIWVELARAHVNAGQLERAREAIERPTEAIPEHLRWLRLRTLARLLDAEGRAREADDRRVLLRERAKGEQAYQQRLADLDAALRDDGDLVPVLSALRANPPQKMAGLWEDGLSAREQAQRLAREYPY